MEKQHSKQTFYMLCMFLVACIWGGGFIATVKVLEAGYSEGFLLAVRFTFAALVFGFVARKQFEDCTRASVVGGLLGGFVLFLAFYFQTIALPLTTPSNNAFLTSVNIMIVPFLAWAVFHKKPTVKMVVAAGICFLGILVISVSPGELTAFGEGDLLSLLCAVCFALHSVIIAYFAVRGNAILINFFQMLVASLCSIMVFLWEGNIQAQFVPRIGFLWIIYLAVLSTVVAYFIQTMALKHLPPTKVQIIASCESVIASILSLILGYDPFRLSLMIGGGLVFLSIIFLEIPFTNSRIQNKGESL